MNMPSCALPVWRELYDKAIAFREIACWKWMSDSAVFGVQNSANGEIGYCCVLGELSEVFGLVVYLGTEGLDIHRKIQSGKMQPSSAESVYGQKCLTAWFSNRGELDKTDLATAKKLGYNFRGRNLWPQFRSLRPGYYPWPLAESEVRYLTQCLDQARLVAIRLEEDPGWIDAPKKHHYLVRVPLGGDDAMGSESAARDLLSTPGQQFLFSQLGEKKDRSWRSEWRMPAPLVQAPLPSYSLDEVRLQRIKTAFLAKGGIWEIDAFYTPSPIDGDDRPYFPYTYLCVDHDSGMIFDTVLAEPSKWPIAFPQALLAMIENDKVLPNALWLRNGALLELLKPLALRLGVDLVAAKKLPRLDQAKRGLLKFLDRQ